jgi:predicted AlkP superfamily phosphohydrolase/phosphomutase
MTADRLFVIGLDSIDKDLAQQWAAEGCLPTFKKLLDTAIWGDTENPIGLETGSTWTTYGYGLNPAKTGQFDASRHFDPETYLFKPFQPETPRNPPIWTVLSDAGKLCGVIDFPYDFPVTNINGIKINDRFSHVPAGGGPKMMFRTHPKELADDILERFGPDPAGGLTTDQHVLDTPEQIVNFCKIYHQRLESKIEMALHYWNQQPFDFFLTVFTEAHTFGHRLWRLHDKNDPNYDPSLEWMGNPLKDMYIAIDGAVARIMDAVKDDARIMVHCSHGMGPRRSATYLLDRILVRLAGGEVSKGSVGLKNTVRSIYRKLPSPAVEAFKRATKPLRDKVMHRGFQPNRKERPFFEVYGNDNHGGVRINLIGREPHGKVSPEDYDRTCDQIIADMLEVVNDDTGEPLVVKAYKTRDLFDGPYLQDLPDILLKWNRSSPIVAVRSPKIGRVDTDGMYTGRSGDHLPGGRFFAVAPDWPHRKLNKIVHGQDFAPTIAQMFGVTMEYTDGHIIEELVPSAEDVAPEFKAAS